MPHTEQVTVPTVPPLFHKCQGYTKAEEVKAEEVKAEEPKAEAAEETAVAAADEQQG